MLGEATSVGLLLDSPCEPWIFEPDATDTKPEIHESYHAGWWFSDWIPRLELDNSRRPPGYPFKWLGRGARCTGNFRRNGNVCFHSTVGIRPGPGVETVETLPRLTRDEAALAQQIEWMRARQPVNAGTSSSSAKGFSCARVRQQDVDAARFSADAAPETG
jgi:hypothetical protein